MPLISLDDSSIASASLVQTVRVNHEDVPIYHFRRKLMARVVNLSLGTSALEWDDGISSGSVNYADVAAVRMRYEPGHLFMARYWVDIESRNASPVRFANWGWRGLGEIEVQNNAFRGFVGALHQRLGQKGRGITFVTGEHPLKHALAMTVGTLCMACLVLLMVKGLAIAGGGAVALLGACFLFFGWQVWLMASRNRPGTYHPDALPLRLLPPAETDH